MIEFIRTPDDRFTNLPRYPFDAHYADVGGLRMHYVDTGPAKASPVLLLHGEPSWSYLYRHMIPVLVEHGHRVIAPDLIGFGKSDKPVEEKDYSVARHVGWLQALFDELRLEDVTLFGQDWGSSLGLRLAAANESQFSRIVIGNGLLPADDGLETKRGIVHVWRAFTRWSPWVPVGHIVSQASGRRLAPDERAAYDAPFPDERYLAGVRIFPRLIPMSASDPATPGNVEAWRVLREWQKPFLTIYSDGDPVLGEMDALFQARVPGAKGLPHDRVPGGHFVQEVSGPILAEKIHQLISTT